MATATVLSPTIFSSRPLNVEGLGYLRECSRTVAECLCPCSCAQPIIWSVMTTDLAPASLMNASTSSVTRMSSRMSAPVEPSEW
jgi:hypothetical protein